MALNFSILVLLVDIGEVESERNEDETSSASAAGFSVVLWVVGWFGDSVQG